MVLIGELAVLQALQNGMALFSSNLSTIVPDLFAQYPTTASYPNQATQQTIIDWFSSTTNQISLFAGYPQVTQRGPYIAVTLAAEDELPEDQIVGSVVLRQVGNPSSGTPYQTTYGAYLRSVYRILCGADNMMYTLWLQALVKWCLYSQRLWLETTFRMYNQRVSASDFIPQESAWAQESVPMYLRVVTLTADHLDSWQSLPDNVLVTSVGTDVIGVQA